MQAPLKTSRSVSLWELEAILPGPRQPGRHGLVRWHRDVTQHEHVIAVGALLIDGDREAFFSWLLAIAENGRRVSARLANAGFEPPPASANLPVLAALAAGDLARAEALGAAARADWSRPDGEYEDEFLWAATVNALAASAQPDAAACEARLAALEATEPRPYLERIALVRALLAGDARTFARALLDARHAYEDAIDKRSEAFGVKDTDFPARAGLWLEGLALLRLAERAGLPIERVDLRFLPAMAQGSVRGGALPRAGLVSEAG